MSVETFPVLGAKRRDAVPGTPVSVPWALLAPHEAQAERNHYQSLRRLAERGGLSPAEMVAVLEDRPWRNMDPAAAVARLNEIIKERSAEPHEPGAHICAHGYDPNSTACEPLARLRYR